jgi:hypothetical protein
MANLLKLKRGTRAQLNAGVSGNLLNLGEPYLITDEGRIAVGTGSNSYATFAKSSEIQPIDGDLTAIAGLTGTGFLKRTGTDTWALDTNTYLTTLTDTLATVTARGATTTDAIILSGGVTIGAPGFTNGAFFAGAAGGTTKVVASTNASGTLTLPAATGTFALTSDLPTVNNGSLTLAVGLAAFSGNAVTVSQGTGYSANTASDTTYFVNVGPSLTALATFMSTSGVGFIKRGSMADTYTIDTNTYITANETISISGDATGTGNTAISLSLANIGTVGTYTKVTTDEKGRVTAGTTLSATDIPTLTANKISDFDTQVRTSTVSQLSVPNTDLVMNSQKITGLADPISEQDAATKAYVDSVAQGLDAKASVTVATIADITLSGTQTIDGVALIPGNRVLVKDQSTTEQNGIYIVAAGAWSRALDADTWNDLISAFTFVEQGTLNADTGWVSIINAGGTLGVTSVSFVQFSAAGAYTAGTGLTSTGNTFNVIGTTNRIIANADSIDIASTYVGQTSITTLGTVTAGIWSATAIGVTKGGLGLTSALTGLIIGNGTSYSAAIAGTDYLNPNSIVDGGTF